MCYTVAIFTFDVINFSDEAKALCKYLGGPARVNSDKPRGPKSSDSA